MFFLQDFAEFKKGGRKRGSKNKRRKVPASQPLTNNQSDYPSEAEYKRRQDRREEINNARRVVSTGASVAREARGWAKVLGAFR